MTTGQLLVIILVVLMLGSVPVYPYSRRWGYRPISGLTVLLIILLLVLLLGG